MDYPKPYIHPLSGEPAPVATGGKRQPKGKQVKVKAHTRTVKVGGTTRTGFRGQTPVYHAPDFGKTPHKPTGGAPAPSGAPGMDPDTKRLIDAAVRLKFGGAEQGINQQLQANARFASGVPGWYAQAVQNIQGLRSPQQPVQTVPNAVSATGSPEAIAAAQSRTNLNASFANQQQQNQQANQDWLTRLQGAMQVQQGNTLNSVNRDRQQLLGQQGQLKQQEGDFRLTYKNDLDSAAAKSDLEDRKLAATIAIAQGKNDLAVKILNQVTKPNAANQRKVARTNARTNAKNQEETAHQHAVQNALDLNKLRLDAYLKAHPELGKKGGRSGTGKPAFTPTQKRKAASNFRTISAGMDENAVHKDPSGAVNALVKGKKTDPVVANAVVESIINHGSVTRDTATAYYRATGHHLHVGKNAKHVGKNLGQIFTGFLNGL